MKKKSVHKNETEMEKCLYLKNGTEARCGSGATVPRTRQKEEKYVIEMDYR